ncbi:MAG: NTP transferase domain-containing protein [Thermoguttaceae bacterium]
MSSTTVNSDIHSASSSEFPKYAVVMAAGKGTRMKSELPKVLFPVGGRPMIEYVLDALDKAGISKIFVVVGYRSDLVRETLKHRSNLVFVEQTEQLGTGHAVMMCREAITGFWGPILVVAGDCPMIQVDSVQKLFAAYLQNLERPACILGTAKKENPIGLGRIVRDKCGEFEKIVEEKDATAEQKLIQEVNMSYYVFDTPELLNALLFLKTDNSQNEYYITDAPAVLKSQGKRVVALPVLKPIESLGINTIEEAKIAEEALLSL